MWIISRGVVAREISDGELDELPIDTKETLGAVGLTTRADSVPSMALKLFMNAIRDTAQTLDSYYKPIDHHKDEPAI